MQQEHIIQRGLTREESQGVVEVRIKNIKTQTLINQSQS